MQWSPDSELLALVLSPAEPSSRDPTTEDESAQQTAVVQVWQRSNWHWYLKQELAWCEGAAGLHIAWEPAELKLHMRSSTGGHRTVRPLGCALLAVLHERLSVPWLMGRC